MITSGITGGIMLVNLVVSKLTSFVSTTFSAFSFSRDLNVFFKNISSKTLSLYFIHQWPMRDGAKRFLIILV